MAVISDAFHLKGSRRPLALSEVNLSALGPSETECAHLFCLGCGLTGPGAIFRDLVYGHGRKEGTSIGDI
jgi:hypothetical protein